jgi:hypothetical protein
MLLRNLRRGIGYGAACASSILAGGTFGDGALEGVPLGREGREGVQHEVAHEQERREQHCCPSTQDWKVIGRTQRCTVMLPPPIVVVLKEWTTTPEGFLIVTE